MTKAIGVVQPIRHLTDEDKMLRSVAAAVQMRHTKSAQLTHLPSAETEPINAHHEVDNFQDDPLRKHGLDAFLESLLILSDFLIPERESFQFHLHLIRKLAPPDTFIILNSIQRVVCVCVFNL